MDKIVALAKRRGFVFPGSDIYGGLANTWDYGPLGVELKNNIKQLWWRTFIHRRRDMVGLDAGILMHPRVWEASGHVAGFTDPLVDCRQCKNRFRADDPRIKGTPGQPDALKQDFAAGRVPDVYVRTGAAELISVQGEPQFVDIPGTKLSYIDNTGADVIVDGANNNAWYVLVSGRWFTAPGSKGPWTYVSPARLPADFAKIPPDSPKSGVLASIPNTPESKEALIANGIPQTATT